MPEQETAVSGPRLGFDGSRWINQRPTPEEVEQWFESSFTIDPALSHADYVGGIVLIPTVEQKAKYIAGFTKRGEPVIEERPELSYVPYARVETRLKFWWNLLEAHPEWVGVVERVEPPRLPVDTMEQALEAIASVEGEGRVEVLRELLQMAKPSALATMVHQLPPGFSIASVPVSDGYSHFLCCTMRVALYRADDDGRPIGQPLREGVGTKQVPLVKSSYNRDRTWADENAIMRCETGALGRALGFAGIFVLSGIASAEDVVEAMTQGTTPVQAAEQSGPAAPPEPPAPTTGAERAQDDETEMRRRAATLFRTLSEEHPEKATEFGAFARERKLASLGDAKGAVLRGALKKLERLTDEAERSSQQTPLAVPSDQEIAKAAAEAIDGEPR